LGTLYYDPLRKDELTGKETLTFDGQGASSSEFEGFSYDEIGNPVTFGDKTMTWDFVRCLTASVTGTCPYNVQSGHR